MIYSKSGPPATGGFFVLKMNFVKISYAKIYRKISPGN